MLAANATIHEFSDTLCHFLSARREIQSQYRADKLLDKIIGTSQVVANAYHILDTSDKLTAIGSHLQV
jgi:hypothetical protein